jgi:hypothetical protein
VVTPVEHQPLLVAEVAVGLVRLAPLIRIVMAERVLLIRFRGLQWITQVAVVVVNHLDLL